jgi:hypothetical protein
MAKNLLQPSEHSQSLHEKEVETAFWAVHDHFTNYCNLPSLTEWRESLLKSITIETRKEAFGRSPMSLWEFSHVELMMMLFHELPHYGGKNACDWKDGAHMCSPRMPEKGIVKLAKVPDHTRAVNFKDAVFLLTRDASGFAEGCDKKQVIQICFSSQCFAPEHLVLADHEEIESRRFCSENPEIQCLHDVICLRGPKLPSSVGDIENHGLGLFPHVCRDYFLKFPSP